MKVGDTITCLGPGAVIFSGAVLSFEPLKTRSGWSVLVNGAGAFMLRPEDEGVTWSYGDSEAVRAALIVANALGDKTEVVPRLYTRNDVSKRWK